LLKTSPGLVFLLLAAACGPRIHNVTVEGMDVALAVRPDGHAQVSEHLTVQTADPAATSFRRRVPVWKHDGVADVIATMPSAPVAGPTLDVGWTFPPEAHATYQLDVTYTAANVVGISGIRGTLSWSVLPAHRDWDASAVTVRVELPDSAILLQDPWVEESGWTVTRMPHGMTATRAKVSASESATIGLEFTIDGMTPSTPQWQADQEFSDEFVPAFVSAALFILVIGAGVLILLRIKHPVWRVRPDAPDTLQSGADESEWTTAVRDARDLRRAAVAIIVFGLAAWAGTALTVRQFGAWPLVVPWSVIVVGVLFAVAGRRYGVLSEQGVRARMLYFARVRDGRVSE
jgi:hypothetical protein